tara:strand:+ start:1783 stop:2541 length:759 start_codon:yes stop_codon:yes gene_type:complete
MKNYLLFMLLAYTLAQDEYLVTIPATSYTEWVYFSLETNDVILIDYPENSTDWDFAFQRKHIKTNSGLSGPGNGGAFVDSVGNLEIGSYMWSNEWENLNTVPDNISWIEDSTLNDFYDLQTHTYVEGVKNAALNAWGWFNESFQLIPTNYVMFAKSADGLKIVKFWAYDYYENNYGGNVSVRYQIISDSNQECQNIIGDVNNDNIVNIVDIISIVNFIITNNELEILCGGDFNNDNLINIIDVIGIVNLIIN